MRPKIGIGVEGVSDRDFWRPFLRRIFPGIDFKFWTMKGREKLIRRTPDLLDTFRNAHFAAGIIIVDCDKDPCITHVMDLFEATVKQEFRTPREDAYFFLCVAVRKMENWFLADEHAVSQVLPDAQYDLTGDSSLIGVGTLLKRLWKERHGATSTFNKRLFAASIAPHFDPDRAGTNSHSFARSWMRITSAVDRARRTGQ